jgi:hypothetical protein
MVKVSQHARWRAVTRLGMERAKAGKKLLWLHDVAKEVGLRWLPTWFRPKRFAPRTQYRLTNYAGFEVVLVEAPVPDGLEIVTLVTRQDG